MNLEVTQVDIYKSDSTTNHKGWGHIKREPTNIETHCIHYTTPNPNKQISYIYKKQSPAMSDNTLHIKEQWELGLNTSVEDDGSIIG